jgi:hypothetical protein
MRQTPNMKLNLPDPSDPADVSVLNANFEAIDAAGRVKLKTIVTSASAYSVELDFSDVDFTKFRAFDLFVTFPSGAQSASYRVYLGPSKDLCFFGTNYVSGALAEANSGTPVFVLTGYCLHREDAEFSCESYGLYPNVARTNSTLLNAGKKMYLERWASSTSYPDVPAGVTIELWGVC